MTKQFQFREKSRTNLTLDTKGENFNKRGRRSTAQIFSHVVLCAESCLVNSKLASETKVLKNINIYRPG